MCRIQITTADVHAESPPKHRRMTRRWADRLNELAQR